MHLTSRSNEVAQWTLVGPMGPKVPSRLEAFNVLAVDGGASYTSKIDVWVGDSDSYLGKPSAPIIHQLDQEKSKSDLGHALELVSNHPRIELHLWGFLGGRRDHEMINFGEVLLFSNEKDFVQAYFYGPKGDIEAKVCSQGQWSFDFRGTFSILTLEPSSLLITGDCKYTLEEPTLLRPFSSLALSNEGKGIFQIFSDKPFIILFNYEE
jgi:thiamine pyrophosphokinase